MSQASPNAPITEQASTPVAEAPKTVEVDKLAHLEKALRQQAKKYKDLERRFTTPPVATPQAPAPKLDLKSELKRALQAGEISYEELGNEYLSQPSPEDAKYSRLEAKIAQLEGELGKTKDGMSDSQKQAYDGAIKQVRSKVDALVASDERFELTRLEGKQAKVVDYIETTYKEDGVLLTEEEAAQEIEAYLEERALKVAQSKKIQTKLAPAPVAAQEKPSPQSQQPHTIKTLTRSIDQQAAPKGDTERDRVARAVAAFNANRAK